MFCRADSVARMSQEPLHHLACVVVIFDHQDGVLCANHCAGRSKQPEGRSRALRSPKPLTCGLRTRACGARTRRLYTRMRISEIPLNLVGFVTAFDPGSLSERQNSREAWTIE